MGLVAGAAALLLQLAVFGTCPPASTAQQPLEPLNAELCPLFAAEAGTVNGWT